MEVDYTVSDFKFACPGCGQRIAVTDEYVGRHVNCPACQAAIVVPANPAAPQATKLGVSALNSTPAHTSAPEPNSEQQGSAAYEAHRTRKVKRSYAGVIAGVAVIALIGLSAFVGRDWLARKWKEFHGSSAAGSAAANRASSAPAEPTVEEIWQNVVAAYKGLTSLSATGTADSALVIAGGSAGAGSGNPQSLLSADLSIKLGRPDNFRIDVNQHIGLATISNVGWSAGRGYYVMHNSSRRKESSRNAVFGGLGATSPAFVAGLFFNDADGLPAFAGTDWSRTNGAAIPGQPCYVLAGTIHFQNARVWVNKQTFLIHQVQIVLDGNTNALEMDDAKIKETLTATKNGQAVTSAEITQFKTAMKSMPAIQGTLTETYQDIQTNVPIALAEMEPQPATAPPAARGPRPGAGGTVGPSGGVAPTGRASRIAAGARRGN
jgi:hypothetical protein